MKNVITVIILAILLVAGCADMTASLWDERDNAIGGRFGYVFTDDPNATEGQMETGLEIVYWPDGKSTEIFGAYGMYKFGEVETPNPLPMEFLPETLKGIPYIGGKVDTDGNNTMLFGGMEINNTIFMEYRGDFILIGLKRKF